jgi:uncharacterized membrane protein YtjA (UPF0391 family)
VLMVGPLGSGESRVVKCLSSSLPPLTLPSPPDGKGGAPNRFLLPFPTETGKLPCTMLRYALIFLVVAMIAELFGFSGIAGQAGWVAHVLLVIALIFLVVSFVTGRGGPTV